MMLMFYDLCTCMKGSMGALVDMAAGVDHTNITDVCMRTCGTVAMQY
jgi:hypothetical protein